MMEEYISRTKTLKEIKGNVSEVFNIASNAGRMYQKITEIVESVPAADVAPVVRCQECKHWKPGGFMGGEDVDHMYRGGKCPIRRFAVYENDFCSKGERR